PLPYVLVGVAVWVVAFTAAGFWWYDGYDTLVERYYQGAAGVRPYWYFIWANLAAQVLSVGLATVAGLTRAVRRRTALVALVGAGLLAMLIADVSGMSKAETERIWLPFADRKSTRLNSSHVKSSYAVFCLKKKQSRQPPRAGDHASALRHRQNRFRRPRAG